MLADKFVNSVWEYLASKKFAVAHLAAQHGIDVCFETKTYAHADLFLADPIELIEMITPSEYGTNDAIDAFFHTIGERRIIDREATMRYLEVKGASSYLVNFMGSAIGLSSDMSITMPSPEAVKEKLGPLANRFTFLFPEGGIYAGSKAWLHITAYGVLSGVTVKTDLGYVTIKSDFVSAPTPLWEGEFLPSIHRQEKLPLCIDTAKSGMAAVFSGTRYASPMATQIVIDEAAKPSKIDALFETCELASKKVFIGDKPLHRWVADFIMRHKGWQEKLDTIAHIITSMNSVEFNLLIDRLGKDSPAGKRVAKMRLYGSTNLLGALGIEPVAKVCCNINAPSEIFVSIRGTIEAIPVSEQARQQFMSRGDLKKEIEGLRHINARIASVDDKSILSMAFDSLRDAAETLPTITNIAFDGIWKLNNRYTVVAKGTHSDYMEAMSAGYIAQAKFVHFNATGRTHERNLVRRVPAVLADVYIAVLDVLFMKKKGALFTAVDLASAKALASHLMESCSFVRKISLSRFASITKQLYNTRLLLMFIEQDSSKAQDAIFSLDSSEFLGIKKEHGILFEPRNTVSAVGICTNEESGTDFNGICKGDHLLDDMVATIVKARRQERKLAYFKQMLDEKAFI